MSLKQAIEILKEYNEWRLGADLEMLKPQLVTEALKVAIEKLDSLEVIVPDDYKMD